MYINRSAYFEFEEVYKNYNKIIHYLLNHYHITYNYDEFYQLLLIKMWQLSKLR